MKFIRLSKWTFIKDKEIRIANDVIVTAEKPEDVKDDPFYIKRALGYLKGIDKVNNEVAKKWSVLKVELSEKSLGTPANQ